MHCPGATLLLQKKGFQAWPQPALPSFFIFWPGFSAQWAAYPTACLIRLLQLPNTPICTGTACPIPGAPRACRMLNTCSKDKGTNKPTDLPEPHGRILVCPSAPPNSCDVSQDQEFRNTIPLSKQQTSHGCHHGHALCPCHGHPCQLCPPRCLCLPAEVQSPQDLLLAEPNSTAGSFSASTLGGSCWE